MANLRLVVSNELGAARHSDPVTSQLAAQRVSATHLELLVYDYLFKTGLELTALEIARGMHMDIRTVSPRLKPPGKEGQRRAVGEALLRQRRGQSEPDDHVVGAASCLIEPAYSHAPHD